jgi:two pore calcium channel protein
MYLFAAIGTLLYGGLITRGKKVAANKEILKTFLLTTFTFADPNNPLSTVLLDTEFAESDYWGNNFNDMMSGMNVLFNLLIINNWTVCESGFEATTGGKVSVALVTIVITRLCTTTG